MKMFSSALIVLSYLAGSLFAIGGPPTVGSLDINIRGFIDVPVVDIPKGEVVFIELNYSTYAPMYFTTFFSNEDVALGLYDLNGVLILDNSDSNFPGDQLHELRPGELEMGTYYLAVGLGDVSFGADFEATSNSGAAAILDLTIGTFPFIWGQPVKFNRNYNGIVHAGEGVAPDALDGFRSISDRALDFRMGTPNNQLFSLYNVSNQPGELDMLFLGNRNNANGGLFAYDIRADGDCIGVQPDWLSDPDQTMPAGTSFLVSGEVLSTYSHVGVLYQIDGGGSFDLILNLRVNAPCGPLLEFRETITGPDWLGGEPNIGSFSATTNSDCASPDAQNPLTVSEAIIDLTDFFLEHGPFESYFLDSLKFELNDGTDAVAVLGVNFGFVGVYDFLPKGDFNFDGSVDVLDIAPFVDSLLVSDYDYIADINDDCVVDLLDVQPFVQLLISN